MNKSNLLSNDSSSPLRTDTETEIAWASVLGHVRRHVSGDAFERWFSGTSLIGYGDGLLIVGVPNSIHQFFIESNFLKTLRLASGAVLGETLGEAPQIDFQIIGKPAVPEVLPEKAAAKAPSAKGGHRTGPSIVRGDSEGEGDAVSPKVLEGKMRGSAISPKYTFGTYVVGASNQFASAAAAQVAANPGRSYNPLFIFGGSGLGKTHLMQAIGRQILESRPKLKVLYVTGEQFTNDFIEAIREQSIARMRKRYRRPDVLLFDDVQFIAGKDRTQEEFFHTFNALADGCRQIVLSSDRPPSEIPLLEKRLISRFEWGLTASVQPPEMETRTAILQKKMEGLQVQIAPEIIHFIAENIRHNVRRLEGALMRIASLYSLNDRAVTVAEAADVLSDMLDAQQANTVTIDRIQKITAEHYDIRVADMTSKRRPKAIAFPRQIAMSLARHLTPASYTEIGEAFGGRDHGTVMHACKRISQAASDDPSLKRTIEQIEERLRQGEVF